MKVRIASLPDRPAKSKSKVGFRSRFLSRHRHVPPPHQALPQGSSSFCSRCENILLDKQEPLRTDVPYRYFEHHAHFSDLQASIDQGCYVCTTLWMHMEPSERQTLLTSQPSLSTTLRVANYTDLYLFLTAHCTSQVVKRQVSIEGREHQGEDAIDKLAVDSTKADNTSGEDIDPSQCASTNSQLSWRTALQWLEKCTHEHAVCKSMQGKNSWYPSRLIDVGQNGSENVRLIETKTALIDGPYMSLSHCWGKGDFLQLTESNHSLFKDSISMANLSRTFQDAIEVTRQLGVRYLWIDSLCIIQQQESKEDWLYESPQMGKVYSNAYCNICATSASDGAEGLFNDRNPYCVFPKPYSNPITQSKVYLYDSRLWENAIHDGPLMRRGWVVQERILAPRVLHFGHQQIYWECCEWEASERFPDGLPHSITFPRLYAGFKKSLVPTIDQAMEEWRAAGSNRSKEIEYRNQPVYELWYRLLSVYTKAELTFPGDKLVAISGLAAKIESILNVEYVAGMWNDNLPLQLMWQVRWSSRKKRPADRRAPSFTWASVDGLIVNKFLIEPESAFRRPIVQILDISVTHIESNTMGLHTEGCLWISGTLKKLGQHSFEADAELEIGTEEERLLLAIFRRDFSPFSKKAVEAIVLEAADGIGQNKFRRIGIAALTESEWDGRENCKAGEDVPSGCYDAALDRYKIQII